MEDSLLDRLKKRVEITRQIKLLFLDLYDTYDSQKINIEGHVNKKIGVNKIRIIPMDDY